MDKEGAGGTDKSGTDRGVSAQVFRGSVALSPPMRQARNLVQTGSFQRRRGKGAADSSAESNRHASSSEEEPPSPQAASMTSGADSRRSSAPSARSSVDSTDDEDSQGKKRPSNMEKFVDGAKIIAFCVCNKSSPKPTRVFQVSRRGGLWLVFAIIHD